jgi:hypothetical protein
MASACPSRMTTLEKHELKIWTAVVFGLFLYVGTFFMAVTSTQNYRDNQSLTPEALLQAVQE